MRYIKTVLAIATALFVTGQIAKQQIQRKAGHNGEVQLVTALSADRPGRPVWEKTISHFSGTSI